MHKSYGAVHALRGVDLRIAPGEIVALLGVNGAGKSTLLSIVSAVLPADRGTVAVMGFDVAGQPREACRRLGVAQQDVGVYPTLSVRQNLDFFGRVAGLRGRGLRAALAETADAVGLTELLDRRAGTLSGGQQRRLHTAMALVHAPPVLLLDEATVGADVQQRANLLELVRRRADDGAAVCWSTHYLAEVEALDAGVAILDAGRIIAQGRVAELVANRRATVHIEFDGPAPPLSGLAGSTVAGSTLSVPTDDVAATTAEVMRRLDSGADRVRSIDIVRPSLDSVFLTLTGRRFADDAHAD